MKVKILCIKGEQHEEKRRERMSTALTWASRFASSMICEMSDGAIDASDTEYDSYRQGEQKRRG